MSLSFGYVLTAFGLGAAYAATPGVVNTECIRRGLAGGFRSGFSIQLGAMIGDPFWAILALLGVAALSGNSSLEFGLGLIGGLFLCRLAFKACREALVGSADNTPDHHGGGFRTGAIFGLANPAGLAFWAGIGGGTVVASGGGTTTIDYVAFLLAFMSGALVWSLAICAGLAWGRRFVRPGLFRAIDATCGTMLAIFGVRLLWTTLRRGV